MNPTIEQIEDPVCPWHWEIPNSSSEYHRAPRSTNDSATTKNAADDP